MNNREPSTQVLAGGIPAIAEIQLPVEFSIGTLTSSLGELESIQPGFVFELTTPVDRPITIAVNGTAIGRGELLRIGDRLGVRLVEIIPRGNESA